MAAHRLADVTIVADAGMISEANKRAIEAAGLSFILGMRIPDIPHVVTEWRREHAGEQMPDGLILTQPWPAGPADKRRDQVIYYRYKADRARRAQRGIDEQVAKAEKAVAGKVPVKSQPVHQARRRRQVREPQVTVTAGSGRVGVMPWMGSVVSTTTSVRAAGRRRCCRLSPVRGEVGCGHWRQDLGSGWSSAVWAVGVILRLPSLYEATGSATSVARRKG